MYAIQVGKNTYVAYYDTQLVEFGHTPCYKFEKERALEIVRELPERRYIYKSAIVDTDGNRIEYDAIAELKAKQKERREASSMVDECFEM